MQISTSEEKHVLDGFEPQSVQTRRQLMPVWFLVINALLIFSGVSSTFQLIDIWSNDALRSSFLGEISLNLIIQTSILWIIRILNAVPAVLFFTQHPFAATWAKWLGTLRLLATIYYSAIAFPSDGMSLLINLPWIIAIMFWLNHAFGISKRWKAAPRGPWARQRPV